MVISELLKGKIHELGIKLSDFEDILDIPSGKLHDDYWDVAIAEKVYEELRFVFGVPLPSFNEILTP